MSQLAARLILLHDDPRIVADGRRILAEAGCEVVAVQRAEEAIQLVRQGTCDALLAGVRTLWPEGSPLLRTVRQIDPHLVVVMIADQESTDLALLAVQEGAQGIALSPFASGLELVRVVQTALEHRRIVRESVRLKELVPLIEINQRLLSEVDIKRLYERVLETVQSETGAERVSLMLVDERAGHLYVAAAHGLPDEAKASAREPGRPSIAGWVAKHGQPLLLNPGSPMEHGLAAMLRHSARSALSVPLSARGRVIGVLNASIVNGHRIFNQGDQEFLTILAGHAAIALDNARLYAAMHARAEEFRLLNEVSQAVSAHLELGQILDATLQGLSHLFDVEAGALWLREEGDTLACRVVLSGQAPRPATNHPRVGQGIAGWVVAHGQVALVPDVRLDPRFDAAVDGAAGFAARTVLCVPLRITQRSIGAVELINKRADDFTTADAELLGALAASVSMAIDNAQLLDTIRRSEEKHRNLMEHAGEAILLLNPHSLKILEANAEAERLTGLTRHRLQALSLYDIGAPGFQQQVGEHIRRVLEHGSANFDDVSIPHRDGTLIPVTVSAKLINLGSESILQLIVGDISRLRRMERQLLQSEKMAATGRLAASLAHEINNPLQAIQNCLFLITNTPLSEDKRLSFLRMANAEVERLMTISQRMLDFYRPSPDASVLTDVNAVLEDVFALAHKRLQHGQVTLHRQYAPGLPGIMAIPNQLKQVFLNLLLNGIESMPQGGDLWVSTRVEPEEQSLAVDFRDSGGGIPPSELSNIYEPFYSTKSDGTGLGLSVSYSIVERHGGRIDVQSEVGKGSKFTVRLPLKMQ